MVDGKMAIPATPFDAAKYLTDEVSQIELLNDALHEGQAGYIASAIGVIAKARGLTGVASGAGLGLKALGKDGNPTLDTFLKVLAELGIELEAKVRREPEPV
jgi:probable addiction module antidote protein